VFQRGEMYIGMLNTKEFAYSYAMLDFAVRDVQLLLTQTDNPTMLVFGELGQASLAWFQQGEGLVVFAITRRPGAPSASVAPPGASMVTVSPSPSQAVLGALSPGTARFMVTATGEPGFALGLPNAMQNEGARASLYTLGDAPSSVTGAMSYLQMTASDVFCVEREASGMVEVDVYDLQGMRARTLKVAVEDDALGGTRAPSALVMPSTRPLTSLSPTDLNAFAMRRRLVQEAPQLVFLSEGPDADSLVTIDFLGVCRVWYVTELAVRRAFAEWRARVGFAEEGVLKVQYVGVRCCFSVVGGEGDANPARACAQQQD
jgi:hypothetical protein